MSSSSSSSSGSSSGGASSSGSTTGLPPLPIVDGGYVFCFVPDSPIGGPDHDGGAVTWMCEPGTYLCDLQGPPGNCFQCLSDADCANRALPTHDQKRARCDLTSGVPGYQNFCQQCVQNADCAANPVDPFCELVIPLPGSGVPPLDLAGFEACGPFQTDCRADAGVRCAAGRTCDPSTGVCVIPSTSCTYNADCAGLLSETNEPLPYCTNGTCNSCPTSLCLSSCHTYLDCTATGAPDGSICTYDGCTCSGNADCSGIWPTCLTGSYGTFCGCAANSDCGDAGLACLNGGTPGSYCGLSCSSPLAPACPADAGICEPDAGVCIRCNFGSDCRNAGAATGYACVGRGVCGCYDENDCPSGESCLPQTSAGTCVSPARRCTPADCPNAFCDWDSGACVAGDVDAEPPCITDFDCGGISDQARSQARFCANGQCAQCIDDNDCVATLTFSGPDTYCNTRSDRPATPNTCNDICRRDADCVGNREGPTCIVFGDSGVGRCFGDLCRSNADCAASALGPLCVDGGPDYLQPFGACSCLQDSDCSEGLDCHLAGSLSYCTLGCSSDGHCPAGYTCDPYSVCRPRCDDGGACDAHDPVCDAANAAGRNGQTAAGSLPGLEWCYACITSDDCPTGEGCSAGTRTCGPCFSNADCASGVCNLNSCVAACDAGGCAPGQRCDADDIIGLGANLCYQCLSPIDCPPGEGCNSATHRCGSCDGPTASLAAYDCPPGEVCTNYWSQNPNQYGACLQTCDDRTCPADHPICATFPPLTPDHALCFGCLSDDDCASAGVGYWCDTSVHLTFTCQPPAG